MVGLLAVRVLWAMRNLGREFMPELEEGNLWVRAVFPVHASLDAAKDAVQKAREIMISPNYPEVQAVVVQMGRPDDGTDPAGYNNVEPFLPPKPEGQWPGVGPPRHKPHT